MKKTLIVSLAFVVLIITSLAFTREEEVRFKNLKVLPKNINKYHLDSVMNHFTASLGVKCDFCHSFNQEQKAMDFPSDAIDHKIIARSMMRMTAKINSKYFDIKHAKRLDTKLEVTCLSCHNGRKKPAKMPSAQNQQRQPRNATDTARQ